MSRLLKFVKLPAAEKTLFIEAFFFVAAVRIGLWTVPFGRLRQYFDGFLRHRAAETPEADWAEVKRIVRSVKTVSRFVPFASCLTQALAALLLIRLNGQEAELKIGVAKDAKSGFDAHAWLEKENRIIIGKIPEHGRYMILHFNQGQAL